MAVLPAIALSPSVAGFGGFGVAVGVGVGVTLGVGVGVGVGVDVDPIVIAGGAVYGFGHIDATMPAAAGVALGGLVKLTTPIWLL